MKPDRMRRVDEAVRKVLGDVLQRELKDPRVGFATVTGVRTSSDLSHAQVLISVLQIGDPPEHTPEDTIAGLRSAVGWPDAPRPVLASELLPERALDGDLAAREYLVNEVYAPTQAAGAPLLDTLTTYLEQGSSLEATARLLYVHPNTVRYRLRRVAELTGLTPTDGRGAFTLRIALVLGRFAERPHSG